MVQTRSMTKSRLSRSQDYSCTLGTLLGLCNPISYRLAVCIGNELAIEIYEHKKGVKKSFFQLANYIINKGSVEGYIPEYDDIKEISELEEIHDEIYVYHKTNLVEAFKLSNTFFNTMLQNFNVMNTLELGDIVGFAVGPYTHTAIFVDMQRFLIIHNNGKSQPGQTNFGTQNENAFIRKDHLIETVGIRKLTKYNVLDQDCRPRAKEEIVKYAEQKIGKTGYDLFDNNCQHFANECRYGKRTSPEVSNIFSILFLIAFFLWVFFCLNGK